MSRQVVVILCVFLSLLCVGTGCGSGNNTLNPAFQPQVSNVADNFQFQATGVTNVTQTLTYTWQDTGTGASINQACAITAGSASLTLKDASGAVVYSGDLSANGTFTSTQGVTGSWTLIVTLTKIGGTLNFRVQKM